MQLGLKALFRFLDTTTSSVLVLATVVETIGASYRKAGAMMLIDRQLNSSGLVSGGCLEDDLKVHAEAVFQSGQPKTVIYDLSEEESASMWGLGLGCGGEIRVFLERVDQQNEFGGLTRIRRYWEDGSDCGLLKIIKHEKDTAVGNHCIALPGETIRDGFGTSRFEMTSQAQLSEHDKGLVIAIPVSPANRLLVCGGGPDAIPLVSFAAKLSWQVTVIDHRPAYLNDQNFPQADQLLCCEADSVDKRLLQQIQAAVVMTHNVERDAEYLRILAAYPCRYIGLLGPAARRLALIKKAGLSSDQKIFGPSGLDIGSVLPEEIALSILAEIQAVLSGKDGRPLSSKN